MFEREKLIGSRERSIIVETLFPRRVENFIALPPTEQSLRKLSRVISIHGGIWDERKPPCGKYNCAGHVWASRRTAIYDDSEWLKVLEDDGYRQLRADEEQRIDDIVIYRDENAGFLHVGRLVENRSLNFDRSGPFIPMVLSKWDSTSGEYLHSVYDAGHLSDKFPYLKKEWWTDRPEEV